MSLDDDKLAAIVRVPRDEEEEVETGEASAPDQPDSASNAPAPDGDDSASDQQES